MTIPQFLSANFDFKYWMRVRTVATTQLCWASF